MSPGCKAGWAEGIGKERPRIGLVSQPVDQLIHKWGVVERERRGEERRLVVVRGDGERGGEESVGEFTAHEMQ